MKKRPPVISLGQNAAEIKIYTLRRANGYQSHQCTWREMGRRQVKTFAQMSAAKLFAQQKTVALANGLPDLSTASQRDIEILKSCEALVERFGSSITAAIEEWANARQLLSGTPLSDAARFYTSHHAAIKPITVASAVDECIAAKTAAGFSLVYQATLKYQLKRFVASFGPLQLADISTRQIDEFFQAQKLAPTSKNCLRKRVVTLLSWAREKGYLMSDRPTAAEKTTGFVQDAGAPEIYTPLEMKSLLVACSSEILPGLAIGGFTGIRTAEIARLAWEDVLWDRGFIEVKAKNAKTRARRLVPISANLAKWLDPFRSETGLICPSATSGYSHATKNSGVEWKHNALRHSYASYRLAQTQDAAKVALEMGNSPAMLFAHYREIVTPEDAEQWFGIVPPEGWSPEAKPRRMRIVSRLKSKHCVDTASCA